MEGNVYRSTDYFNGMAIAFDTCKHDQTETNSLISIIFNDGTQKFDHSTDGASQASGSCMLAFRNTEETTWAKITYLNSQFSVHVSVGRISDGQLAYRECISGVSAHLGVDKYFESRHIQESQVIHRVLTQDLSSKQGNIDQVRQLHAESLGKSQSLPSHRELSPEQFQHSVLTSLSQIQQEFSLITQSKTDGLGLRESSEGLVSSSLAALGIQLTEVAHHHGLGLGWNVYFLVFMTMSGILLLIVLSTTGVWKKKRYKMQ